MDRRGFILGSVSGAVAGLSVGGFRALAQEAPKPDAETSKAKAVLKLCSRENIIPGNSLAEKIENMKKFGGVGMEFLHGWDGKIAEIKAALKGTGIGIGALAFGSCPLIDPDKAVRDEGAAKLKEMLSKAGELGGTGVIVIPRAKAKDAQPGWDEGRKILMDVLPAIGEHAVKAGSRIVFEPLNKGETKFLKRVDQAAELCKAVASPGVCLMGDFFHMAKEGEDDEKSFLAADGYLHNVHLASRGRFLPGQDDLSFVAGFRGLKKIGYQDYCSLECKAAKGTDPMIEIPKSFALLRKQWDEAIV